MNATQRHYIEEIYFEMFELLIGYARSALENESLAEEAVQETFRIACLKPDELINSPNPKGWLVNTLKNTIRNSKRSRDASIRLLAEYLATHGNHIGYSEDRFSLEFNYEDIANLEEFKLIKEMAVEGKSQLEMAQSRGITLNACKKRVQRAKELLRKLIQ